MADVPELEQLARLQALVVRGHMQAGNWATAYEETRKLLGDIEEVRRAQIAAQPAEPIPGFDM